MPLVRLNTASVIFDMDGVITNTMPDHYLAWKMTLHKEGIPVTYLDVYSREGQRGLQSVKEFFQKYKKPLDERKAGRLLRKKEEHFKRIVQTRFVPGARLFLKDLHRNNFCLALVTGTSRHELKRILPDSLCRLFSVIITGSDVRYGKPHAEPYLKALARLKIKPAQAVAIENAPLGIQSAKKAGLRCLALATSLPAEYLKGADAVFPSIRTLRRKIRLCLHQCI